MPKRTNPFQQLVMLIEAALIRSGATVRESEELVDRLTGKRREVDIVIRHDIGQHTVVISVECTAKSRPATIEWVEQQHSKHQSLGTHKLILVSRIGFTDDAKAKAKLLGVDTLSLEQAEGLEWEALLLKMPSFTVSSFLVPFPKHIQVILAQHHSIDGIDSAILRHGVLVRPVPLEGLGDETCTDYVNRVLRDEKLRAQLRAGIPYDGSWTIDFKLPFLEGTQLRLSDGRMLPVWGVAITAECRVESKSATLTKAAYGQAAVVHAASDVFGHSLDAVFAQQEGQQAGLAFRLERKRTGSE